MQLKKPDPCVLTVWRLRLIPAAALLLYLSFRYLYFSIFIWCIFTGLWISAAVILAFVYFPAKYRRLSYGVNSHCFIMYGGVLTIRIKAVPFHAVQYASVLTTPLMRQFAICSLIIYMAGSHVTIPGLTFEEAESLRGKLAPTGGSPNE